MRTINLEDFKKQYMSKSNNDRFDNLVDQHPLFDFMNYSNRSTSFQNFRKNNNQYNLGINNFSYKECFNHHL